MGKIIWAINATIDGYADHNAGIADDELHDFYTNLLSNIDIMLFGRKTYQLMESYWPTARQDPSANKSTIDFADIINPLKKVVFSRTLKNPGQYDAKIISEGMIEEIKKLKAAGKNLGIGGISIAAALLNERMIDEYWFLIQPIIFGRGIRLVDVLPEAVNLKLIETKPLRSGVVVMHYENA